MTKSCLKDVCVTQTDLWRQFHVDTLTQRVIGKVEEKGLDNFLGSFDKRQSFGGNGSIDSLHISRITKYFDHPAPHNKKFPSPLN